MLLAKKKHTRLRESAARRERGSCCCVEHELSFSLFVAKGTRRSVRWDSHSSSKEKSRVSEITPELLMGMF